MSQSKKVKSVRLHPDTHDRLEKWKIREECKSADEMVSKMIDAYEVYKGKTTKDAIEKSSHRIVKELNTLQDDLVDAINGLRKTYQTDSEWNKDFGNSLTTFANALKFPWAKAQKIETQRLKRNPKLSKLRLKWIEQILNIVWQIEKMTMLVRKKKLQDKVIDEILGEEAKTK